MRNNLALTGVQTEAHFAILLLLLLLLLLKLYTVRFSYI